MNESQKKAQVLLMEPGKLAKTIEIDATPAGLWRAIGGEFDIRYPFGNDLCVVCRADSSGLKPNRALRELDKRQEMSYRDLTARFREQEGKRDGKHLHGHIVFSEDSWPHPYSEVERTYWVSSDNKAFIPGMGGYSIYGSSLDGSDLCTRLEGYMAVEHGGEKGWQVEKCYLIEPGEKILEVVNGPFLICDGSDRRIRGLNEVDLHMLQDQYFKPERIKEVDGQIQTERYYPQRGQDAR